MRASQRLLPFHAVPQLAATNPLAFPCTALCRSSRLPLPLAAAGESNIGLSPEISSISSISISPPASPPSPPSPPSSSPSLALSSPHVSPQRWDRRHPGLPAAQVQLLRAVHARAATNPEFVGVRCPPPSGEPTAAAHLQLTYSSPTAAVHAQAARGSSNGALSSALERANGLQLQLTAAALCALRGRLIRLQLRTPARQL